MVELFKQKFTKNQLMQHIGNISQVGGIRYFELKNGDENGIKAVEFRTGTGFSFTSLLDRGMDIASADWCHRSLCWRSCTGDRSAAFFEPEKLGWLRNFFGGLVITCGLTQAGAPNQDGEEALGLHGRIANIPAKNISIEEAWEGNDYWMTVKGYMRESIVFGANLVLYRTIKAKLGENRFFIEDKVVNEGFETQPLMLLYHINGGYPAVAQGSVMLSPTVAITPRDEDADINQEQFAQFQKPTKNFQEQVYYHKIEPDNKGLVHTALVNRNAEKGKGFGFYVIYNSKQLPYLSEWKMMGQGTYTVGIEPGTCRVEGRSEERKKGRLQSIKPGETRKFNLELGVLTDNKEIEAFAKKTRSPKGKGKVAFKKRG